MIVLDQDSALLNRDSKNNSKVEQLLPEPEAVLPRPAAPPKPTPPSDITAAPPKPEPPHELAAAPASAPPLAPLSTPYAAASAPAVAPSPVVAAMPPAPRSASGSGYRLQLGAVRSEDAAKQEWQRLQKSQSDVLGKLGVTVERADLGEKGIFYRIQAGPITDANEAAQSCTALKNRNVGCILVKP